VCASWPPSVGVALGVLARVGASLAPLVNYHRYMPYAIIVGMLSLPEDAMSDRKGNHFHRENYAPFRRLLRTL